MPRRAMAADASDLNVAMINGKLYNALTLSEGFMELTNDAKTLARKRSELNTFLRQVAFFWNDIRDKKIPCAYLMNWFARYLDEHPLAKQSAVNKITTVVQALLFADLVEPDPIFQLRFETMRKSAITLARNNKAEKAPVIVTPDPFVMLPAYSKRLAVIWLMTGVRYISLPEVCVNYQVEQSLPFEAASALSWKKTVLPSKPLVFCTCSLKGLADACPIHTTTTEWSMQLPAIATTVMKYWQTTRHSCRRTLAIAFVLCSKWLYHPELGDVYRQHLNVIFGWVHKRGKREKDMFMYYTEDSEKYVPEQMPTLVRKVVEFYDDLIPIIAAKPVDLAHFSIFKNWLKKISALGLQLSDVQRDRQTHDAMCGAFFD